MANRYYTNFEDRKISSGSAPTPGSKSRESTVNEKTAAWPGLPGKSGPDRSGGVKKVKAYAKSEGI
jgi:hypothetical protein